MWKHQFGGKDHMLGNIFKDEKVMINNFDAANRLMNLSDIKIANHYKSFRDKQDLFFIDYDLIPLLV